MMRQRQRGVALVLALGVAAMATIAATAIMVGQGNAIRHAELQAGHAQAQQLASAGIDWARAVLHDDRRLSNVDHHGEPWALRQATLPFERGEISGGIEDQQGLFNLNNLLSAERINAAELLRYRRLLHLLELPDALADTLADWLDADDIPRSMASAEDAYYLALDPPYTAANRPLFEVAELALVRGYDELVLQRLRPFVSALPRATQININTAPAELLAATLEGLDLDAARGLVAQRERAYFVSLADLTGRLGRGVTLPVAGVAFNSDFFMVDLRVRYGPAQARATALLQRETAGWPVVTWRKIR